MRWLLLFLSSVSRHIESRTTNQLSIVKSSADANQESTLVDPTSGHPFVGIAADNHLDRRGYQARRCGKEQSIADHVWAAVPRGDWKMRRFKLTERLKRRMRAPDAGSAGNTREGLQDEETRARSHTHTQSKKVWKHV